MKELKKTLSWLMVFQAIFKGVLLYVVHFLGIHIFARRLSMQSSMGIDHTVPISIIDFERSPYGVEVRIDSQPIADIIKSCAAFHYDNKQGIASIYNRKDEYVKNSPMLPFGLQGDLDGYEATVATLPLNNCDDALLRICGCGYAGCACITVQMRVTELYVEWSDLQFAKSRFGPYPGFGTVVFDRKQYQAACELIHSMYSSPKG